MAPAALIGIDVVDTDRIGSAIDGVRGVFLRRVFSANERAAIGTDLDSAAVGFAVKECLIKAIGGRPEPFSWHDFETDLRLTRPLEETGHRFVDRLAARAAIPFGAAMGVARVLTAPCAMGAGARRAALLRLSGGTSDVLGELSGMALWGWNGRLVTAIAVTTLDSSNRDRPAMT